MLWCRHIVWGLKLRGAHTASSAVGVELPARIGVARVLADLENTATSAAIKQALST
ncbi:hypothetical protein [Nocardia cyriacigeorgica]|uniref:hypothetical protein n=1 Tax=Nocardia cyriacigeorgica TaxID=135487 RepID=UPI0002EEF51E|nr:hypothetical protein [Nocardia cyriacigeorgica]